MRSWTPSATTVGGSSVGWATILRMLSARAGRPSRAIPAKRAEAKRMERRMPRLHHGRALRGTESALAGLLAELGVRSAGRLCLDGQPHRRPARLHHGPKGVAGPVEARPLIDHVRVPNPGQHPGRAQGAPPGLAADHELRVL